MKRAPTTFATRSPADPSIGRPRIPASFPYRYTVRFAIAMNNSANPRAASGASALAVRAVGCGFGEIVTTHHPGSVQRSIRCIQTLHGQLPGKINTSTPLHELQEAE
ncbi:hypothetical protein ACFPRL_10770 [Pseudoclavibacter helvolus]